MKPAGLKFTASSIGPLLVRCPSGSWFALLVSECIRVPFEEGRNAVVSASFWNPRKVAGVKFAVLPDPQIRFLSG